MKIKYNRNMTLDEIRRYAYGRLLDIDENSAYDIITRILDAHYTAYEDGYSDGWMDRELGVVHKIWGGKLTCMF